MAIRFVFRGWVAERTNFLRDVYEADLAHAVATIRIPRISEVTRKLIAAWAGHCGIIAPGPRGSPMRRRAS
jgi:hypothetical protein